MHGQFFAFLKRGNRQPLPKFELIQKRIEIINQHTLLKIQAYPETGQNNE